jgi:alpha-tubulin suppressor-like RCC1 family protein
LTPAGALWAWGNNWFGQLGDGATTNGCSAPPNAVRTPLTGVVAAAGGFEHSLALTRDGKVWAWGGNDDGELGDGTTSRQAAPVPVATLDHVTAIAAGGRHSLALRDDGSVWAWGNNDFGQLGDGTLQRRLRPVRVVGIDDAVAIDAGPAYSLAIRSGGTVWMWGDSSTSDPTDWPTDPTAASRWVVPTRVPDLANVLAVAAGAHHALALTRDGQVLAWGNNRYGQIGDGTTTTRPTPVWVPNLRHVVAVSAGFSQSLALEADGSVWSWGDDLTAGPSAAADSRASTIPRVILNVGPVGPNREQQR